MKRAIERHKDAGIKVLGIGIQDSKSNIKKFAEETKMNWPVGFDKDGSIAKQYAITFGAGGVFIDREGVIRSWYGTVMESGDIEQSIEAILKDYPKEPPKEPNNE